MPVTGSIRKFTIDGTSFDVAADANVDEVGGLYEKTAIPTSGKNGVKLVKRAKIREGIVLITTPAEKQLLEQLADSAAWYPCAYTTADAITKRAVCQVEFIKSDTQENRSEIKLIPEGEWT